MLLGFLGFFSFPFNRLLLLLSLELFFIGFSLLFLSFSLYLDDFLPILLSILLLTLSAIESAIGLSLLLASKSS
jgi:NADH:ubiquinone oxidoreductase subunit K